MPPVAFVSALAICRLLFSSLSVCVCLCGHVYPQWAFAFVLFLHKCVCVRALVVV